MKNKQEFICKDNFIRDSIIGILVIGILISISTIIGILLGFMFSKITIVDGIIILSCFEVCGIVLIVLCARSLSCSKTTYFTINSKVVTLVGKKLGKDIFIERNIDEIRSIVIKRFRKAKCIVLIDDIGEIGRLAASQNGEFIKIQYSRKRLNKIKFFLPNCPVNISKNTEFGEL